MTTFKGINSVDTEHSFLRGQPEPLVRRALRALRLSSLTPDGVDTAHYQTLTGAPLPALKFATTKASEGGGYKDPKFVQLLTAYRKAIPVTGAYHFVAPGVSAADQFANFAAQCKIVGGCDLYQIDWEATIRGGVDLFPDVAAVFEFEDRCLQKWGDKVVTYSAPWVTGFNTWMARPHRSPLWLADYSSNGPANAKRLGAVILQYSSSVMLSGFTGRVDGNTIVDQAAWSRIVSGHVPDIPAPQPVPQPPSTPPIPGADIMIRVLTVGDAAGLGVWLFDPSTGFHHMSPVLDAAFNGRLTDVNMDKAAVAEACALYGLAIPAELL